MEHQTKVIAIINQKGGVAKTTTTAGLAYSLSKLGRRVLCIDWDQQASLSYNLGYMVDDEDSLSVVDLLADYIANDQPFEISVNDIQQCIHTPTYKKNVQVKGERLVKWEVQDIPFGFDLLPSSITLSEIEMLLTAPNKHTRKKTDTYWQITFLDKLIQIIVKEMDYDYILIDCAPALNTMSINALMAACGSGGVIVPSNLDVAAIRGIINLKSNVEQVEELYPKVFPDRTYKGIIGIVLSMYYEKRKTDRDIAGLAGELFPYRALDTKIPETADVRKAGYNNTIVNVINKKMDKAFMDLAQEIIDIEENGKPYMISDEEREAYINSLKGEVFE